MGQTGTKNQRKVEVLYQKLGNRWFAFSLIDSEVFFGAVEPNQSDADGEFEISAEDLKRHGLDAA